MRALKVIFVLIVVAVLLGVGFSFWLSDKYVVPILGYHHVEYGDGPKLNTTTAEIFSRQMRYLKNHGFSVISLDELVEGIKKKKSFPKNTVVITFDDGYEDNYTFAFPILRANGFPATIFIIAGQIDQPGHLTLEHIKEMERHGIVMGSHTVNHSYLPSLPIEEQHRQIEMSKKILEEKLGHSIDYFAYPSGGFSEPIKAMVQKAGYKGALTTNRGYHRFNEDVYELKRVRLNSEDRWSLFLWAKLSGYYNFFRSLKDPH